MKDFIDLSTKKEDLDYIVEHFNFFVKELDSVDSKNMLVDILEIIKDDISKLRNAEYFSIDSSKKY